MSYEAWGEPDEPNGPEGCWHSDTVEIVQRCIKELLAEPVYEDGQMAKGISTRFLARLTILRANADLLDTQDPAQVRLLREAEAMFAEPLHPKRDGQ
jgi:hypothetical protein